MKLKSLLLSALMLLSAGTAWADVEINETNFPDANFRNYLLSQNYGNDGVLTDEEIAGVKALKVSSKYIQSLKGIEFFTALTELDCSFNYLTSLDVSKNTELKVFTCWSNQITSLNVSGSTALTTLYCSSNPLTSLDVSGCTNLINLYCDGNSLTSLDVSKNAALTTLFCYNNQLTSLDVSKNTALISLSCYNNSLTSLDVSKNTALERLDCYSNQLTSLNVSGCTNLADLNCYQNQIKGAAMDALVESLPTVNGHRMGVLYENNEQNVMNIAQVAAARAKGWTPYIYGKVLQAPYLGSGIAINEDYFPDTNLRNFLLGESYGSDGMLTGGEISNVTSLDVSSMSIQSLKGIEYFMALTDLRCSTNQFTSLDMSGCTALETLSCNDNQLTSLDVSKNTKLRRLDCYNNQLTSLDLSKNTALTHLECYNNKLTSLDVSKNTKLWYLFCYQNQIKGEGMDALVASLPTVSNRSMRVVYYENEQNVMTTTQVDAAKTKGWWPYYTDGSSNSYGNLIWNPYSGVDPSTGVNNVEASEADDSAPWYTINGTLLSGKPTEKGIYIHNGKKVVVK